MKLICGFTRGNSGKPRLNSVMFWITSGCKEKMFSLSVFSLKSRLNRTLTFFSYTLVSTPYIMICWPFWIGGHWGSMQTYGGRPQWDSGPERRRAYLCAHRAGTLRAQHQGFSRVAEAGVRPQQGPGYTASFLLLQVNANLCRWLTCRHCGKGWGEFVAE